MAVLCHGASSEVLNEAVLPYRSAKLDPGLLQGANCGVVSREERHVS